MLRVDRVRIAQPVLDVGDGERQRPGFAGRPWRRLLDGRLADRPVEGARPVQVAFAATAYALPAQPGDRCHTLNEARRDSRRAFHLGGAAEDDLAGAEELCEIMRRQRGTAFRQIEPEFEPHRATEPSVALHLGWPAALVESAENDTIEAREAR